MPSIAAFCAAMGLALWLALPGASLADRLAQSGRSDPLSIAYLTAWLAARPDDLPLHVTLARQHLALGDWDRAIASLAAPIAHGTPALRRDAQWLKLDVLERAAYAAPEDSPRRTRGLDAVAAQLQVLSREDDEPALGQLEMADLVSRARGLGQYDLARTLLARQARLAPPAELPMQEWLAGLAATAESLGEPLMAADLQWRAFDAAGGEAQRRVHFFAAVRLMQAADRGALALEQAAARIARLSPDTGLMRFMVRLALAAGRPDLADRYAREMLRFALLQQWRALSGGPDAGAPVRVSLAAPGVPPPRPRLAFDDATYALAFDVFVANRNLNDAFEVAAAAVRHAPRDAAWRRRLAQVAEWTTRPDVALEQWLAIARAEGRAADWAQVERFAAQTADGSAMLEALTQRALRGGDEALDDRIAALIEDRGDPRGAIDWLTSRIAARGLAGSRRLLHRQLALHEALGDAGGLLAWLARADAALGPDAGRARQRAALLIERGDTAGAFDSLQAAGPDDLGQAPSDAAALDARTAYWTLYAALATRLQRESDADDAYRALVALGRADDGVLTEWSMLLEPRSLRAAARVAERAWQAGGRAEQAERAFALWLQLGDFTELDRLGRTLPPAQLAALRAQRGYLHALATHLLARGDDAAALRTMQQALATAPDDAIMKADVLWMLLAQRQAVPLRAALLRWEASAERDAALWGPFGAAWMALDEPKRALRWFVRQSRAGGGDDYLWQLGYADCLERNGHADSAWNVRRRAWLELRAMPADRRDAQPWRRQATLALAMRFAPTDAARDALRAQLTDRGAAPAALPQSRTGAGGAAGADVRAADAGAGGGADGDSPRALLRQVDDALAAASAGDDGNDLSDARRVEARALAAGSRELALSWMLSRESTDAARAWLLARYASQLARPAWARLSVALAAGDRGALVGLLDELPDWLPRQEQVDAMLAVGRTAQAQTLAWQLHDQRPLLDDAHRRFVDTALRDASHLLAETAIGEIGVLGLRTTRLQAQRVLRPGLAFGVVIEQDRQRSLDATQLQGVPDEAGRMGVSARWRGESVSADVAASRYFAIRDRAGLRLDLRPQPDPDRGPSLSIGLRQPAPESAALQVGGMKDFTTLRWALPLTSRDRVAASVTGVRLASQDGSTLGRGTLWMLDATHRLRLDYPDVSLRALALRSDWTARPVADTIVAPLIPAALGDPAPAVIPASSTEIAAGLAFGDSVAQTFGRALRPFGEALLRANSVSGTGYSLRAGATTSLLGTDRLSGFLTLLGRTPGIPRSTRAIGLAYQFFF
jgi:tetratricopeptide (TPR) repeat protein